MRQSRRSRKTSPIQSPIPAFPKGKEHHTSPILTFPKGNERHTTTSNTAGRNSRPLGRAWGGAYTSSSNVKNYCKQDSASSSNMGSTRKQPPASSSNMGVIVGRRPASSSNSDGVAIPQPRVAGEARYPGYPPPLIWQLYRSCD